VFICTTRFYIMYPVFKMKIWIYWSESNSWKFIFIYISK
jgi:hypothetical protein